MEWERIWFNRNIKLTQGVKVREKREVVGVGGYLEQEQLRSPTQWWQVRAESGQNLAESPLQQLRRRAARVVSFRSF